MSLADLSGTPDEWERWREDAVKGSKAAALGASHPAFFLNFMANEGKGDPTEGQKLDLRVQQSAGSRCRLTPQMGSMWNHTAIRCNPRRKEKHALENS